MNSPETLTVSSHIKTPTTVQYVIQGKIPNLVISTQNYSAGNFIKCRYNLLINLNININYKI